MRRWLLLALFPFACQPEDTTDIARWPGPDLRIEHSLWLEAGNLALPGRGVIQRRGDRLDLLLLAPTGQRLLTVQAQGRRVEARASASELARLEPRRLLDDIHWAFFDGCPSGAGEGAFSCQRSGRVVTEFRNPEGLVTRRLVPRGKGTVEVVFEGWIEDDRCPGLPSRVRFSDPGSGYHWEARVDRCRLMTPER